MAGIQSSKSAPPPISGCDATGSKKTHSGLQHVPIVDPGCTATQATQRGWFPRFCTTNPPRNSAEALEPPGPARVARVRDESSRIPKNSDAGPNGDEAPELMEVSWLETSSSADTIADFPTARSDTHPADRDRRESCPPTPQVIPVP